MSCAQSGCAAATPRLARLMFEGGARYDGMAVDAVPHSFGALHMADGSRYVGQWEQGRFVLGEATRTGDLKCTGQVSVLQQQHSTLTMCAVWRQLQAARPGHLRQFSRHGSGWRL